MSNVLLVIHLLLALALILVVLMQRTASDGGGLMGGGGSTMGGLFTARGSANLLTRTTAILATCFICTSMILGILATQQHKTQSIADQIAPTTAPMKTEEAPKAPEVPTSPAPQVPVSK